MWKTAAAAIAFAIVVELLALIKAVLCAVDDANPDACDGLRGGGRTFSDIVLLGVPALAILVMIGVWRSQRVLVLLPNAGLVVAFVWLLSVGSDLRLL